MRWLTRIRMALSDVVRRERFEREMDEELDAFLALDAEERKRSGRAALVNLGGVEPTKERLRDLLATASLESAAQDLRFAARLLRRHPGFAAAAILTIALGVGPLTVILSLANGLFVRPAPGVRDSYDLVQVEFVSRSPRGGTGRASVSYLNYAELTAGTRVFSGLAGQAPASVSVAAQGTQARRVPGSFVMHDYFDVLGVRMAAGRTFAPDEDREPGGAPVAILSQRLSRTLFAEAASTPGRTLLINGLRFTVIGVAPQGFHGTEPGTRTDVWLTGARHCTCSTYRVTDGIAAARMVCGPVIVSQLLAARLFDTVAPLGQAVILPKNAMHGALECHIVGIAGDIRWNGPAEELEPFLYRPLGRDAFGLSRDVIILARSAQPTSQVVAALRGVTASIDPAVPPFLDRSLTEALDLRMAEQRTISRVLALLALLGFLMAAVGLYGLVAETVVERTREFGIRMAVGASRPAIFAVVLRQATVLAAIGMTAGLGLAAALSRVLRSQLFGVTALEPSIYIGAAGLLATVVLLASLTPAIAATRVNPVEALRAE